MRSFEGLDDGNIEEEGTSILMRSIENSEVRTMTFIFVGRTEDMTVFTYCSREGMISTDFKCASHGTVDALARTMLGTASEEMAVSIVGRPAQMHIMPTGING